MRARQQLLRTLITDIIVDVDDDARDVVLTIHWRGGQHSELRVRKPRAGEHGCATNEDALATRRLKTPGVSVAHVGAEVGYESEAAFNRAFKKVVGKPPGVWRKARDAPSPIDAPPPP